MQPQMEKALTDLVNAVVAVAKPLVDAVSDVYVHIGRAFDFLFEPPRPTPEQIAEIGKAFTGKYWTVGEAFQSLQETTQAVATNKWLLVISKNNLANTKHWHFIRRWRLKQYVAELQAVIGDQTNV